VLKRHALPPYSPVFGLTPNVVSASDNAATTCTFSSWTYGQEWDGSLKQVFTPIQPETVCSSNFAPPSGKVLAGSGYRLMVKQYDLAGNISTKNFDWTVTRPAPPILSAPTPNMVDSAVSSPVFITNSSSVAVSWSGQSDSKFICSFDGSTKSRDCKNSYTINGLNLLGDGDYLFEVSQYIPAPATNPEWGLSKVRSIIIRVDHTAPSGAPHFICTDPLPDSTCGSNPFFYTYRTPPSDGSVDQTRMTAKSYAQFKVEKNSKDGDVAAFSCTLDGATLVATSCAKSTGQADGRATILAGSSSKGLSNGHHVLQVYEVDRAGNRSANPLVFSWDQYPKTPAAPKITSSSVANKGNTYSTSASFAFEQGDAVSKNLPGMTLECALNKEAYAPCSGSFSRDSLVAKSKTSSGAYTFSVRSVDPFGNKSTASTWTWTVLPPPITAAWTIPTAANSDGSLSYTLTFSESVSGISSSNFVNIGTSTGCKFSVSGVSGISVTVTASGCSAGTVVLRLLANKVTGSSGNTGPSANSDAAPFLIAPAVTPPPAI